MLNQSYSWMKSLQVNRRQRKAEWIAQDKKAKNLYVQETSLVAEILALFKVQALTKVSMKN